MYKLLLFILILPVLLFSCGEAQDASVAYTNGVYEGIFDHFDSHGWKATLVLTIEEGRLVSAKYEYIDRNGAYKSANEGYAAAMKGHSGTTPAEASAELEKQLVAKQNALIDGVTGATHTSHTFKDMAEALLMKAESGDTDVMVFQAYDEVKQGKDAADERGYTAELFLGYTNGELVTVYYNEVGADGSGKAGNESYNSMMADKSGITWDDALKTIITAYKEGGAPVDAVSGATGLSKRFNSLVDMVD